MGGGVLRPRGRPLDDLDARNEQHGGQAGGGQDKALLDGEEKVIQQHDGDDEDAAHRLELLTLGSAHMRRSFPIRTRP